MTLPPGLLPATFGVTHGSGFLGDAIRDAELEMTRTPQRPEGDAEAAWGGHCLIFVGTHDFGSPGNPDLGPAIVEAEWPRVRISRASKHPDTIWATGQDLSDRQREMGVKHALSLVSERYDWPAYLWFLAKVAHLKVSKDLTPLLSDPRWIICSGEVVVCEEAMGVNVAGLKTAATSSPDFTSPADVLRWGLDNGWMDRRPALTGGGP